jgi:MFS family permease
MLGLTIYLLVGGVSSPFSGRLVDRYGVRKVISIGAFIAGLGFILLTQIHNLWLFYGSYVIIGLGMTGISHVPVSATVSNWFKKRRGTALGIASIGIGVGGFVVAPMTSPLGSYHRIMLT